MCLKQTFDSFFFLHIVKKQRNNLKGSRCVERKIDINTAKPNTAIMTLNITFSSHEGRFYLRSHSFNSEITTGEINKLRLNMNIK